MPARISDFFLPQNIQIGSETQPVSYSLGKGVCFLGVKQPGMKLAIHLHLAPRLRMGWVMAFLCWHAFMAWTGTTLPLPLLFYVRINSIHLGLLQSDLANFQLQLVHLRVRERITMQNIWSPFSAAVAAATTINTTTTTATNTKHNYSQTIQQTS